MIMRFNVKKLRRLQSRRDSLKRDMNALGEQVREAKQSVMRLRERVRAFQINDGRIQAKQHRVPDAAVDVAQSDLDRELTRLGCLEAEHKDVQVTWRDLSGLLANCATFLAHHGISLPDALPGTVSGVTSPMPRVAT